MFLVALYGLSWSSLCYMGCSPALQIRSWRLREPGAPDCAEAVHELRNWALTTVQSWMRVYRNWEGLLFTEIREQFREPWKETEMPRLLQLPFLLSS